MKFSIQSLYTWYRDLLRNPKYRWWVILGSIVYLISPFDIAPDVIPIVGQIDDVFLLTLLVTEVSGLVIDSWKVRKGNVDTTAPNAPDDSTSTANTIDVDGIPVK